MNNPEKSVPTIPNIPEIKAAYASEQAPYHPQDFSPNIINENTHEGIKQLREVAKQVGSKNILTRPFDWARSELLELFRNLENTPKSSKEILKYQTKNLHQITEIPKKDIQSLLSSNPISEDLSWMKNQTQLLSNSNTIQSDSRWIHNKNTNSLYKYIGPEAHRLLSMSRLLGLIPFTSIDKLRDLKITSAGASAVAMSLDLLACLGAENITFYDGGLVEPSNLPRFPASMGSVDSVGLYKAQALQAVMYGRNPYGNFFGHPGKVLTNPSENPYDITIKSLIEKSDVFFEVVDNPWAKTALRQWLADNNPEQVLVYLADTAHQPFVGLEKASNNNPFNQHLSEAEIERMADISYASSNPLEALRSVNQMLRHNHPHELQVEFLFVAAGLVPFWSQPPGSARSSADMAAKLITHLVSGRDLSGTNYNTDNIPNSLVPSLNKKQEDTLKKLLLNLFDLPQDY